MLDIRVVMLVAAFVAKLARWCTPWPAAAGAVIAHQTMKMTASHQAYLFTALSPLARAQ